MSEARFSIYTLRAIHQEIPRNKRNALLDLLRAQGLQVDVVAWDAEIIEARCSLKPATTTLTVHPSPREDSLWVLSEEEFSLANPVPMYDLLHAVNAALDQIGAQQSIPALAKSFREIDSLSRDACGEEFKEFGAAAIPELVTLSQDSDSDIRWWALHLIGEIGTLTGESRAAIESGLEDADENVRLISAISSSKLGCFAGEALPILIGSVRESVAAGCSTDLDEEQGCMEVIEAIGRFGAVAMSAVPVLIEALDDPSVYVQQTSAEALEKIGPKAP